MSFDIDDEILKDFLIEGSEILENLAQELVTLEVSPDDEKLLNSIFRGFHTIKGGAGFLAIEPLVDVCHQAENVFDVLRRKERQVTADLMDAVLKALDFVSNNFKQLKSGEELSQPDPELIKTLEFYARDKDEESESTPDDTVVKEEKDESSASAETKTEYAALIEQMEEGTEEEKSDDKDAISDEEFESLLDGMQQKKQGAFAHINKGKKSKVDVKINDDEKSDDIEAETIVEKPEDAFKKHISGSDTTVRVETKTLDTIMNMVGELVLLRNRLLNLHESLGNEAVSATVNNLDVITADLQSSVMKTRMQPIKRIFGRFPRVVRDVARSLNKEVVLKTIGEETDLDKNLVEALTDPLIHLVRNAVDHGIELPSIREAIDKPREGTITLSAEQEGDHILLKIIDDGAGIDADYLRNKVIEKELMDEESAARLTEQECFNLIFLPGFSTKEKISDISGRGVGMDVVKSGISQLNGIIDIQSELNVGTTICIKVPLTLAIMPTLMVELGDTKQVFALPLVSVNEILDLDVDKVNRIDGKRVLLVRGKPVPLYYLSHWLTDAKDEMSGYSGHVVIVTIGTSIIGLLVDKLLGREEVVIKPLGTLLHNSQGVAGATVTGDGKIALILDLPELLHKYANYI